MSTTTDPDDPRLTHGVDDGPTGQAEAYLVLSEEERAKGFVRPVRTSYRHVGERPTHPMRDLTDEERERYADYSYVAYEPYPQNEVEGSSVTGRFWTQAKLDSGCGATTHMALDLAETYARDPGFYGATYCVRCQMHLPVSEFVWEGDGTRLGS